MTNTKTYKIEKDPIYGRQLVARRKILAGELIIDEPALLAGPGFARGNIDYETLHRSTTNRSRGLLTEATGTISSKTGLTDFLQVDGSVCLVCCTNLNSSTRVRCPLCQLLLCSDFCRNHTQHSQNECLIFPKIRQAWNAKSNRTKKELYNLVLVIRGLFLKVRDTTKWAQIKNLDSKLEDLVKVGAFVELDDMFSCLKWNMFASLPIAESESNANCYDKDDDIRKSAQHCLGVMRINAFSSFSESYSAEGLFFISSFMSHCCIINTDRQIGVNGAGNIRTVVRASVDIEKDEPIKTTYLSLLYNSEERQNIMLTNWFFICKCQRCEDFTECQGFSGAITCQQKLVDENSLEVCCNTRCSCHVTEVKKKSTKIISETCPTDLYDVENVEKWLDTYDTGHLVHPNHSVFAHVKLFLCQFYGRQSGGLDILSSNQVKRKLLYCIQILSLYDKFCPGLQLCRGIFKTLVKFLKDKRENIVV